MGNERASWLKRRSEQRKSNAALRYSLENESRKVELGDLLWSTMRRRTYSASETAPSPSLASMLTGSL